MFIFFVVVSVPAAAFCISWKLFIELLLHQKQQKSIRIKEQEVTHTDTELLCSTTCLLIICQGLYDPLHLTDAIAGALLSGCYGLDDYPCYGLSLTSVYPLLMFNSTVHMSTLIAMQKC